MYSKRDQVFVVLCGTDGTANHLVDKDALEEAAEESVQYAHLTELTPEFALPTVETVRQLAEIPDSHSPVCGTAHRHWRASLLPLAACVLRQGCVHLLVRVHG